MSRTFSARSGVQLRAYRQRLRVAHAVWLLAGSNEPLSEIAAACGFADQSHLTRSLRRLVGLSPARFRAAAGAAGGTDGTSASLCEAR